MAEISSQSTAKAKLDHTAPSTSVPSARTSPAGEAAPGSQACRASKGARSLVCFCSHFQEILNLKLLQIPQIQVLMELKPCRAVWIEARR